LNQLRIAASARAAEKGANVGVLDVVDAQLNVCAGSPRDKPLELPAIGPKRVRRRASLVGKDTQVIGNKFSER